MTPQRADRHVNLAPVGHNSEMSVRSAVASGHEIYSDKCVYVTKTNDAWITHVPQLSNWRQDRLYKQFCVMTKSYRRRRVRVDQILFVADYG